MNVNNSQYDSENPFGLETQSDFHLTRAKFTIKLIEENNLSNYKMNLLDVGCGKGIITKQIREKFPYIIIDAIYISEKAIKEAVSNSTCINFKNIDANNFKGYGYLYDIIILNNIYEHIENPIKILRKLKKHLNTNGIIIISTPNRYHIKNILRRMIGLRIHIPQYHVTEYSIGQLIDHHKYAGLRVNKILFPEFKGSEMKIVNFISNKVIRPIFDLYFILVRSNLRFGSLMFIISKK